MRLLLLPLVAVAGCVEPATNPTSGERSPDPPALEEKANAGPVGCALRGEATCEVGQVPKLAVTLINQSGDDIYLVGCLDASYCKWRYPFCYFEVIGPAGPIAEHAGRRCGNMNTLRQQDFVKVPPGGTFDPFQRVDSGGFFSAEPSPEIFKDPGTYRISFGYSSSSTDILLWGGDYREAVAEDEKLVALFARVPKVEVRSNEFKVTVLAPRK
jgi:hypothetical protein